MRIREKLRRRLTNVVFECRFGSTCNMNCLMLSELSINYLNFYVRVFKNDLKLLVNQTSPKRILEAKSTLRKQFKFALCEATQ